MAEEHDHLFSKVRLEALTDGLFATVMTILVLSLVVPVVTGPNVSGQLLSAIYSLLPNFTTYVASFIVLAVMWVGHNNLFRFVHKLDRKLQWLNILLLLFIAIVPFSTAFLGKYPFEQPAIIVYGLNFLALAVFFNLLTHKIMRHHRQSHADADEKQVRGIQSGNAVSIAIYVSALLASFASPVVSLALFAFMPIFYIARGFANPL